MATKVISKNQRGGITAKTVHIGPKISPLSPKNDGLPIKKILTILAALAAIVTIFAYFGIGPFNQETKMPEQKTDVNVTSQNQSGGITAANVNPATDENTPSAGNTNVTSYNQSGGITAGTVKADTIVINQASLPQLTVTRGTITTRKNGDFYEYAISFGVELRANPFERYDYGNLSAQLFSGQQLLFTHEFTSQEIGITYPNGSIFQSGMGYQSFDPIEFGIKGPLITNLKLKLLFVVNNQIIESNVIDLSTTN